MSDIIYCKSFLARDSLTKKETFAFPKRQSEPYKCAPFTLRYDISHEICLCGTITTLEIIYGCMGNMEYYEGLILCNI